jgi:hypothetical protein
LVFGYKLHGVYSISGIFHLLDITKAEFHDVYLLKNIKLQMSSCELLIDRIYLSDSIQLNSFQTVNIKLDPSQRRTSYANFKKEQIKKTLSRNLISLENQEKE